MNILIRRTFLQSFASLLTNPFRYSFSMMESKPNKRPQVPFKKWTILRGDIVKVIAGKDKGKIGKVTKVYRKQNAIKVTNVNIKTKRVSNLSYLLRN